MNIDLNKKEDKKTGTSIWDNGGTMMAVLDLILALIIAIVAFIVKGFTLNTVIWLACFFGAALVLAGLLWIIKKFTY